MLGAQVQGDGPSLTLKKRLDRALLFMQENPDKTVIVSGGQGPDEAHTEASVMAAYLIAHGADALRVIEEDRASNTRENLLFSAQLAEARGLDTSRVLIITSDFHMCRAKYIARTLGMEPYGGLRLLQGVLAGGKRITAGSVPASLKKYLQFVDRFSMILLKMKSCAASYRGGT